MEEDSRVYFQPGDPHILSAIINNRIIYGSLGNVTAIINNIETHKPCFTCAESDVPLLQRGEHVYIKNNHYTVCDIKSDGMGIVVLCLELQSLGWIADAD